MRLGQGLSVPSVNDGLKAKVLDLIIRVLLQLPLLLQDVVIDGCPTIIVIMVSQLIEKEK